VIQFKNKVAIVTGANQGIGLSITKQFVKQGAIVYALDIKEDAKYGEGVSFIKSDVTKEEDWKAGVQQVLKKQVRIDILVNNAGVIVYTPIH
jgi:NAD(P)-dependent dehydrogenase (short-subunit alcohol dehydrogenase family)